MHKAKSYLIASLNKKYLINHHKNINMPLLPKSVIKTVAAYTTCFVSWSLCPDVDFNLLNDAVCADLFEKTNIGYPENELRNLLEINFFDLELKPSFENEDAYLLFCCATRRHNNNSDTIYGTQFIFSYDFDEEKYLYAKFNDTRATKWILLLQNQVTVWDAIKSVKEKIVYFLAKSAVWLVDLYVQTVFLSLELFFGLLIFVGSYEVSLIVFLHRCVESLDTFLKEWGIDVFASLQYIYKAIIYSSIWNDYVVPLLFLPRNLYEYLSSPNHDTYQFSRDTF